jgi:hypothetical protein
MGGFNSLQILFIIVAFAFQVTLIVHFSLRRWRFDFAVRNGWIIYVLGLAAAGVSLWLLSKGMSWSFWLGGFIYLIWGIYGIWIEYIKKVQWRDPINWTVFVPYIILYLSASMFYWFPLALINKLLWYFFAVLFIASTYLNVTSHKRPQNEISASTN